MTDYMKGRRKYHVQKTYSSRSGAVHAMEQIRKYGLLALVNETEKHRVTGKTSWELLVHYPTKKRRK